MMMDPFRNNPSIKIIVPDTSLSYPGRLHWLRLGDGTDVEFSDIATKLFLTDELEKTIYSSVTPFQNGDRKLGIPLLFFHCSQTTYDNFMV